MTPGDAHVYAVTTTGTVTDVDTEGLTRTMGLAVDGYDGPVDVRVYIGQRIPSDETAVRDATGIISFGDFKEQTEYGKVASEINKRVAAGLADTDFEALEGEQVQTHRRHHDANTEPRPDPCRRAAYRADRGDHTMTAVAAAETRWCRCERST